jgi:hypothetical protein
MASLEMPNSSEGIYEGWSTPREAIDRQDVRRAHEYVTGPNHVDSRHIPCVIVQGRYDVVCPVCASHETQGR